MGGVVTRAKPDDVAVLAMFHEIHEIHGVDGAGDGAGFVGALGEITMFGGPLDTEDSGNTASGFSTRDHPHFPYCALPIPVMLHYKLRFGSAVYFQRMTALGGAGERVAGTLWDVGPSTRLRRVADVSPVIMEALGGDGLLRGVRVTFKSGI